MPTPLPSRSLPWAIAYWLCLTLVWGAYCVLGYTLAARQGASGSHVAWGYVAHFVYSVVLNRLLHAVISRRQWLQLPPAKAIALICAGVAVTGLIQSLLVPLTQKVLFGGTFGLLAPGFLLPLWINNCIATGFVTLVYSVASFLHRMRAAREHAQALEQNLAGARLSVLEAQMNPHFLFNALNSLRGMISEDPAAAQDMVTRLANILRHSLTRDENRATTLREELEIAQDYLALEGVRLEERLRVEVDVSPLVLENPMPALALQTLVENAIKHGVAPRRDGGLVRIQAAPTTNGRWNLRITNTGALELGASTSGTRVGLANLRERLRLLFGDGATLDLRALSPDLVEATLDLPSQRA